MAIENSMGYIFTDKCITVRRTANVTNKKKIMRMKSGNGEGVSVGGSGGCNGIAEISARQTI